MHTEVQSPAVNENCGAFCRVVCSRFALRLSRLFFLGFIMLGILSLVGCQPKVRERPYGDIHLGKVADFTESEKFLPEVGFLLRKDESGYYVMSTFCTHDLTALVMKDGPDGKILASTNSTSTYDLTGKVLTGPAVGDLPYYRLKLSNSEYGGPNDALYVEVGAKVPPTYRFKVIQVAPEVKQ